MPNQQIVDYIKSELACGVPKEKIQDALLVAGWIKQDIENAFTSLEQNTSTSATETITISEPRFDDFIRNKVVWVTLALFGISMVGAVLSEISEVFGILMYAWFGAIGLGALTVLYYVIKSVLLRKIGYLISGIFLLLIVTVVGYGSCMFNLY